MLSDPKFFYDCDLCRTPFQFGPHIYAGRPIPKWGKVMICSRCESSNWDGIVPQSHPHFMALLEQRGVVVTLNESGWLDIPPRGAGSA